MTKKKKLQKVFGSKINTSKGGVNAAPTAQRPPPPSPQRKPRPVNESKGSYIAPANALPPPPPPRRKPTLDDLVTMAHNSGLRTTLELVPNYPICMFLVDKHPCGAKATFRVNLFKEHIGIHLCYGHLQNVLRAEPTREVTALTV